MTYPTNAPPKSGHHVHYSQALAGLGLNNTAQRAHSPSLAAVTDSTESLPNLRPTLADVRSVSPYVTESKSVSASTFYTGVLQKKRRRKNQGYARRFFSLDFTSSTLSYYHDRHSSALRGAIPLSLAAIGANERTREISVDSGAEVWHLKALNRKDFSHWRAALERASATAGAVSSPVIESAGQESSLIAPPFDAAAEREWGRVEGLVGRVAGTRDAVRRLAKDTDPKYLPLSTGLGIGVHDENAEDFRSDGHPHTKLPFWKKRTNTPSVGPGAAVRRSVSAQQAFTGSSSITSPLPHSPASATGASQVPWRKNHPLEHSIVGDGLHERCMAILHDLDSVVAEFSALINESKRRRVPLPPAAESRASLDSTSSVEFFDATEGNEARSSQLLTIRRDSDESEDRADGDDVSDEGDSDGSSDTDALRSFDRKPEEGYASLFPSRAKSLAPLPLSKIRRRTTVEPARVPPPSLISFLRKNVGKDLSTIAMPVSANEPISLLQRVSEQLEYSELLDSAVAASGRTGERLLYLAAFAISSFSNSRVKERASRKPFNPMLGETYELVREDKGFRLIAEKILHRPVRMACQAEAQDWTFLQSPMPAQKFWGKSAEFISEGRTRVMLHTHNEHYSWSIATSFLRNVIAGEKYVEPVGSMIVLSETTGAKAIVTFKAGGLFAGRSEEVRVEVVDPHGDPLPLGLVGKWTSHLNLTDNGLDTGRTIWNVGSLVDNAPQRYGFTTFAAALNEITAIEENHIPPTDSRLRPDQRAAEQGDLDRAEALKTRLEERQRARRRVMEEHGESWVPRWFVKAGTDADGDEIWRLKSGKDGYWEQRMKKGGWNEVTDVFLV